MLNCIPSPAKQKMDAIHHKSSNSNTDPSAQHSASQHNISR